MTLLWAAAVPGRAQDAAPKGDYTPVEFTISGGISLGNYEAGLNWAVLRFIKAHQADRALISPHPPPRLIAATGASAGNINALVAAIEWCRQDAAGPRDNLFFQSWIPVGLEGLFAGDRQCVQYCHDNRLETTWAARLGGTGPDACLKACQQDCRAYGGKSCEDGGPAYRADDGLLTRRAFLAVEENFRAALEKGRFDEACKVAVGVTTTQFRPALLDLVHPRPPDVAEGPGSPPRYYPQPYQLPAGGLPIDTQRFVTALRAETRGGRFGFYEHAFTDDVSLGLYLHLPVTPGADHLVAVEDVLALTEASSAFPLAFGPRKLRFCRVTGQAEPATELCVRNERKIEDWFVDGGAFDNVPLGLGYSLTREIADQLKEDPKLVAGEKGHFFYIDPERRRYQSRGDGGPEGGSGPPEEVSPGLTNVLKLGTNFFAVAGKYELQTVARYGQAEYGWAQRPELVIADRLMPIAGKYLFAFGAFLAEPFRRFDFAVGAYDGVYSVSRWVCAQRPPPSGAGSATGAQARCILDTMKAAYASLGMAGEDGAEARYVFHELLKRELDTWGRLGPEADRATLAGLAVEASQWSQSQGHQRDAPPNPAVGALTRAVEILHDEEVQAARGDKIAQDKAAQHQADLAYFLNLVGKDALSSFSEEEQELLADPELFTNRSLLALTSRERQIEKADNNLVASRVISSAQVVLLSQLASEIIGPELDPSSIPDNAWTPGNIVGHLLPYRLMFGSDRLEASWEPTWGLIPDLALSLPLGLAWNWSAGSFGLLGGPAVLYRTHRLWAAGIDLGPRVTRDVVPPAGGTASTRVGAELGVHVLGGKIRLAAVVEDFGAPSLGLRVGLVDFNGLLYWTGRIITGQ